MTAFYETVYLGGGISCLAAARAARGDSILLERAERVGGLCKSDQVDGFTFDRTGHLLHLRNPRTQKLVRRLLAGNLGQIERSAWIYSQSVYTRYPFQSHFYGLPTDVVAECLSGLIRARQKPKKKAKNFADWVLAQFGPGVARHFMFPYNRKLWTVSPRTLTTEWLGRFVPRPDLDQVLRGALSDQRDDVGYNAKFSYPLRGGIESLVRALAAGVKKIECGVEVSGIDLKARKLTLSSGDRLGFGRLVSCAPLPALMRMIRPLPERLREATRRLRWTSVYNLNLGLRNVESTRHWVYVPEDRFACYRFGYASNFSPAMAPKGQANLYVEVAHRRGGRPLDRPGIQARVIDDLLAMGVLRSRKDVICRQEFDLPYAYAIYDRHRREAVARLQRFLRSRDIFSIGRYGSWEYSAMEDALLQGLDTAAG